MVKKKLNSKNKGDRYERKIAKLFSKWWGSEFTRTPSSGGFATERFREDWNAAGDLVTPDDFFPFCVECKHGEGWSFEQLFTSPKCNLIKWWKQAMDETPTNKKPILVFTRNYQPDYFMMELGLWNTVCNSDVMQYFIDGEPIVIGLLDELFNTAPESWIVNYE